MEVTVMFEEIAALDAMVVTVEIVLPIGAIVQVPVTVFVVKAVFVAETILVPKAITMLKRSLSNFCPPCLYEFMFVGARL